MKNVINDNYGIVLDLQEVKYAMLLLRVLPGCDKCVIRAWGFKSGLGSKKSHIATSSRISYH